MQSQKAFDLASSGLLRPKDNTSAPLIYSIKCIKFVKPFFTIQIYTINEKAVFLKELIHDIGYRLKTNAICIQIRRVRDGFIDINSSLAYIEMTNIDKLVENFELVNKLTHENIETHNKTIVIGKSKKEEASIQDNEPQISHHDKKKSKKINNSTIF